MSVQAIRALVLLLNLGLLGLIGWVCYGTFVEDPKARLAVPTVKADLYKVPELTGDPKQEQADLYKAITRVLDRPPPPPPVREAAPPPPAPLRADPRQIQVKAIQYSKHQDRGSALLEAPLASPKDPKFFQVNDDLGTPGMGFEAYKDVKLTQITAEEVILTDQKGQEVRLPGPRPKERN